MAEYFTADGFAAGKKDFIKTLCKQGLVFLTAASDHTDIFRRVSLFYNHFHYSTCSWCVGTWFDDDGIAGGQCVNQRFQCQEYRIIPGTHDQNRAVRCRGLKTSCGELCQWGWNPFFTGQPADMLFHPGQFRKGQSDLTHITFHPAFSQIFFQCSVQILFVAKHRSS